MAQRTVVLLSCLLAGLDALALREWSLTLPTANSGTFSASESTTSTTVSGDFSRLANSFIKLTVQSASGTHTPSLGSVRFGFEVPGFSFFSQPLQTDQTRLLPAILSGECPASAWNGVFVFSQLKGTAGSNSDVSQTNTPSFGTFSWDPATSLATITSARNLVDYGPITGFSSFSLSGTCSNGRIVFNGDGDRGGTLYMTNALGAILQLKTNRQLFIIPQAAIPAATNLNGDYATFIYDHDWYQDLSGSRFTLSSGTSATGDALTDIENGTPNTSQTWTLSNITINSPINGVFKADLSLEGSASVHALCGTYLASKTIMYCTSQTPGNPARPLSLVLVSDNQPVPPSSDDSYAFGSGNGYVATTLPSNTDAYPFSMALHSNGRIVVGGADRYSTSNKNFFALRYLVDGTLDTTFATGGIISHTTGGTDDIPYGGVAIDADDRIYQAGYFNKSGTNRAAVVRYLYNGSLDSSFGSAGAKFYTFDSGSPENAYGVAVQADQKIVLALNSGTGNGAQFGAARILENGNLDTTFNSTGYRFTNFNSRAEGTFGIGLQTDGKAVGVGYATPSVGNTDFMLVRYTTAGLVDSSFGSAGIVITSFSSSSESARAVAFQTDGKVIAVGSATISSKQHFAVARYTSTGQLDSSFGTNGRFTTTVSTSNEGAYALAIQSDNKIVIAGYGTNSQGVGALIRLTSAGALDTSFGSSGRLIDSALGIARGLALQSDGKILFSGQSMLASPRAVLVKRLWP